MIPPALALLAVPVIAIGLDPAWMAGPLPDLDDLVRGITRFGGGVFTAVKEVFKPVTQGYYPIVAVVTVLAFILWKVVYADDP